MKSKSVKQTQVFIEEGSIIKDILYDQVLLAVVTLLVLLVIFIVETKKTIV
jgi:hypothetical protein